MNTSPGPGASRSNLILVRQRHLGSLFSNCGDLDGRDEWLGAFQFAVLFWEDMDRAQIIFLELVGKEAKGPAENH